MFEGTLNKVFPKEQKDVGGRAPYNYLLMFKILSLHRLFNISDNQPDQQPMQVRIFEPWNTHRRITMPKPKKTVDFEGNTKQ